ncbi:MAG: DUF4214 domain-containing protein [Planctomycetes bacterium]|nr:DUF4214 domain-containing protein [Planctomycetota bacterium]
MADQLGFLGERNLLKGVNAGPGGTPIVDLFQNILNRTPKADDPGLAFQRQQYESGVPLAQLATNFAASPEFERESGLFDLPKLGLEHAPTSTSFSGVDFSANPFMQSLLPLLTEQVGLLPGLAQAFGPAVQNQFSNILRSALRPDAFQGTLNQLANRNVLSGDVASDALSRTASDITRQIGDKAFGSTLAGMEKQLQVPGILGSLAQSLGHRTGSETKDPLSVFKTIMPFIAN